MNLTWLYKNVLDILQMIMLKNLFYDFFLMWEIQVPKIFFMFFKMNWKYWSWPIWYVGDEDYMSDIKEKYQVIEKKYVYIHLRVCCYALNLIICDMTNSWIDVKVFWCYPTHLYKFGHYTKTWQIIKDNVKESTINPHSFVERVV